MAVVKKTAAGLPTLTAAQPTRADMRVNHGVMRTSAFIAAIGNGDSAGSTYEVARIPSHARILKLSRLHSSGIAGAGDVDLGTAEDPDCLADGATLVAAGSVDAAGAITLANIGAPLWKLAGLTADPKTEMPVFLTLKTATTAAGTAIADLVYVTD